MIKKIFDFIRSDGLKPTIHFLLNGLRGKLGCASQTVCVYRKKGEISTTYELPDKTYKVKKLTKAEEIDSLDFPRLKYTSYHKWIDLGSTCHVVFHNDKPVAFGWTHYQRHQLSDIGTFDLGYDKAWLGPSFVHKSERGKHLQIILIIKCLEDSKSVAEGFITCINAKNIPSQKSFKKCGFVIGAEIKVKKGNVEVRYLNEGKTLIHINNEKHISYIGL